MKLLFALLAGLAAVSCARAAAPARWHAALVAADASLPVFDNAIRRLSGDIAPHASVTAVFARGTGAGTLAATLRAIGGLRPGADGRCLIYITSHGVKGQGLLFAVDDDVLEPADLAAAVGRGCGAAPTVVVLSGCYSGLYAHAPLAAPNRIVITAARADRPSFGCGAGDVYTVFDACLLTAIEHGGTWRTAFSAARACVAAEEAREGERPSDPQASFGAAVADLPLP